MIFAEDWIKLHQEKRKQNSNKQDVPKIFNHDRQRGQNISTPRKDSKHIESGSAKSEPEIGQVNAVYQQAEYIDEHKYALDKLLIRARIKKTKRKKVERNNRKIHNDQCAHIKTNSIDKSESQIRKTDTGKIACIKEKEQNSCDCIKKQEK